MTRSRFDIEYSKRLQHIDVEPRDDVWNEIQDELDFIETWDNISAKLDEVKPQRGRVVPMRYLKVLAAAAAVILIMFLPVRYFMDQLSQPTIISEIERKADESQELSSEETTPSSIAKEEELVQRGATMVTPPHRIDEKLLASSLSNDLVPIIETTNSESTANSNEEIDLYRIQTLPFDANTLLASNDAIPAILDETKFNTISETTGSSGISIRVLELGLVYGYKNTWLLNHETRNGLDPTKLGNTLPAFHQDIGASTTLQLNYKHQVGLEFLWKSEAGQNYKQYINASFVDRNINLNYLKLQAFYLRENHRIPGQAIVGGYFARLSMAEEQQDNTRFSVDGRYSDLDYGLIVGYQFDIALKNRIIIKPSVRVSYNLVNIFEGDEVTPSHFKTTKNLAASFNISLSYRFFK
jgi:hypothetical protein